MRDRGFPTSGRSNRVLAAVVIGWLACTCLAAGHAAAQRSSAPSARARATDALAGVDLSDCAERPEWAARRVHVGLVVFPGGAYGVALGTVLPAMGDDDRAGLARCIEVALRARLGDSVPLPPRTAFVVSRELDVPGSDAVAAVIRARIEGTRAAFDECVRERADPSLARIDVVARVEVRGGRVVAIGSRSGEIDPRREVAVCVRLAVRDAAGLPDGAGVVTATVTRAEAPSGALPRSDGTEGAICHWGERQVEDAAGQYVLPEPSPCRAGLRCCYGGGIRGVSSSCMRVRDGACPRYP